MTESSEVKTEPLVKLKIFFEDINPRYPKLTDDGKIETLQFLEASRSFIKLYDSLGSAFYVVKKDMLGNVEKLTKVYNKCPEKYKYLQDMIYLEKDDPKIYAVDALLWLKRALQFTSCLMTSFIAEGRTETSSENISHLVGAAYEKVLKQHHNWLMQNIFKVVLAAFPYRSEIIRIFYYGETGPEGPTLDALEIFLKELDSNLMAIVKFYDEQGIEKAEETSSANNKND